MNLIAGRYDNIDSWVDWLIIGVLFVAGMTIWVLADRWWNRHKERRG